MYFFSFYLLLTLAMVPHSAELAEIAEPAPWQYLVTTKIISTITLVHTCYLLFSFEHRRTKTWLLTPPINLQTQQICMNFVGHFG
jgi:hypothetical protein